MNSVDDRGRRVLGLDGVAWGRALRSWVEMELLAGAILISIGGLMDGWSWYGLITVRPTAVVALSTLELLSFVAREHVANRSPRNA